MKQAQQCRTGQRLPLPLRILAASSILLVFFIGPLLTVALLHGQ